MENHEEQCCANCRYYFYKDLETDVKTCWNKEQSHDYVKETDYCFRHEPPIEEKK